MTVAAERIAATVAVRLAVTADMGEVCAALPRTAGAVTVLRGVPAAMGEVR